MSLRRSLLRVAVVMLPVLAAASACKRDRAPAAAQDVLVEVRGPDGHLRLQVARAGDNFGDQRLSWYAGPQSGGNLQSLPGGAGTTSTEGTRTGVRRTQDGGLVLTRNGSVQLNIERRGSVLRLGNAEGFPTGRIQGDGKTARLDGPGGDLQAQAHIEGNRIAISDREGRGLGYVLGAKGPEAALLSIVPGLQPVEQALLLSTELPPRTSPQP